jgi:hypothetical protein
VILIIIVVCILGLFGFFDYASKFGFNDETPEQREEKDDEIVRILSGTSTTLSDRRKEDKGFKEDKVIKILHKNNHEPLGDEPNNAPNRRR